MLRAVHPCWTVLRDTNRADSHRAKLTRGRVRYARNPPHEFACLQFVWQIGAASQAVHLAARLCRSWRGCSRLARAAGNRATGRKSGQRGDAASADCTLATLANSIRHSREWANCGSSRGRLCSLGTPRRSTARAHSAMDAGLVERMPFAGTTRSRLTVEQPILGSRDGRRLVNFDGSNL